MSTKVNILAGVRTRRAHGLPWSKTLIRMLAIESKDGAHGGSSYPLIGV